MVIAAVAENAVIGKDNAIPWPRLPSDMKRFKQLTVGRQLVMGRLTYESVPAKKLPGRDIIVLSRSSDLTIPNVRIAHSLAEAMDMPRCSRDLIVVGGSALYAEALPLARRAVITRVYAEPEGDTFFPAMGNDWCLECTPTRERHRGDEYDTAVERWVCDS